MEKNEKRLSIAASFVCVALTASLCFAAGRDASLSEALRLVVYCVFLAPGVFHVFSNMVAYQQRVYKNLHEYTVMAMLAATLSLCYWSLLSLIAVSLVLWSQKPYAMLALLLIVIPWVDFHNIRWFKSNLRVAEN